MSASPQSGNAPETLDALDRAIVNRLQKSFPLSDKPYAAVAKELNTTEDELLQRLQRLLDDKILTRFGPLFNAEKMGGALSLCAMKIPPEALDDVAAQVNEFPEVAHNYEREHALNMWFVLATETEHEKQQALRRIEQKTGYAVYDMPKQNEYYVGLYFAA